MKPKLAFYKFYHTYFPLGMVGTNGGIEVANILMVLIENHTTLSGESEYSYASALEGMYPGVKKDYVKHMNDEDIKKASSYAKTYVLKEYKKPKHKSLEKLLIDQFKHVKEVKKKEETKSLIISAWDVETINTNPYSSNSSEGSSPGYSTSSMKLPWNLSKGLNIAQQCADYYILKLAEAFEVDTKGLLKRRTKLLSKQFKLYTDMAVGGESRHASSQVLDLPDLNIGKLGTAIIEGIIPTGRSSAWRAWYHFRQEHGTVALKWVVELFNAEWKSSSYGGYRWKQIADTLLRYETGQYTDGMFIDTCFGLEHNGGCYFNKASNYYNWKVPAKGLKYLLDVKQSASPTRIGYSPMIKYLSAPVKKLYKEDIEICLD